MTTKVLDVIVLRKTKNGHIRVDWKATTEKCYEVCDRDSRIDAANDPTVIYSKLVVMMNTNSMVQDIRVLVRRWGNDVMRAIYETRNIK